MTKNIESYVPVVNEAGLNTDKAVDFDSTLNVAGAVTFQSTLAVTGAITATAGITGVVPTEVVTTTNVIAAAESGTTYFLNSATGFVSTLPAPAAGLKFKFICGATVPSSGNHTVVTTSSANIIAGTLLYGPTDDAGTVDADADTLSFVASAAVPGDFVEVISDGTNWFVTGVGSVAEGVTITQAS